MNITDPNMTKPPLTVLQAGLLAVVAVATFHLAYASVWSSGLIFVYLACLCSLRRLRTPRQAFYVGLAIAGIRGHKKSKGLMI